MPFRFVRSAGVLVEPAVFEMYASGTIHAGGVVDFFLATPNSTTTQAFVTPASSSSTSTTVFGVSLDSAVGNSDSIVRVVPFVPGQVWEADTVSAINTLQIGHFQQLYSDVLLNNTSYNQTALSGVFLIWNVDQATTGSGKVLGEFIRTPHQAQNSVTFF